MRQRTLTGFDKYGKTTRRSLGRTSAIPGLRYSTAPNNAPTAPVTPIAKAPHIRTRTAPRRMGAPPARAASAPSAARKTNETTAMTRIASRGARMPASSGTMPPSVKLTDDVALLQPRTSGRRSTVRRHSRQASPRASIRIGECDEHVMPWPTRVDRAKRFILLRAGWYPAFALAPLCVLLARATAHRVRQPRWCCPRQSARCPCLQGLVSPSLMSRRSPESNHRWSPFFGWWAGTALSVVPGWADQCPAGRAQRGVEVQLSCSKHQYT